MQDYEREALVEGFRQALEDPEQFVGSYRQPCGETWKHFLWDCAKKYQEIVAEQEKGALHAYKVQHKLKTLDDLVLFCWKVLAVKDNDLAEGLLDLTDRVKALEGQHNDLVATVRAVEEVQDAQGKAVQVCGRDLSAHLNGG